MKKADAKRHSRRRIEQAADLDAAVSRQAVFHTNNQATRRNGNDFVGDVRRLSC